MRGRNVVGNHRPIESTATLRGQRVQPPSSHPLLAPSRQYHTEPNPHLGFNSFQEGGLPHALPPATKSTLLAPGLLSTWLHCSTPIRDPCGLTRVLFLNANRLQRVKTTGVPSTWRQLRERGFDFIWKVTLELWSRKRGSAQGEEQGLEGRGAHGVGSSDRQEGGVFAYVATLPGASADTDHSRQMKSLIFLKSSRQGAATGFLL